MGSPPLLVMDPIRHEAAGLHLVVPGRSPTPLLNGADPVVTFNAGWHAESLFTVLDPLWVLVLRHEAGHAACWYVGEDGAIAPPPQFWTEADGVVRRRRMQPIALWLHMAPGARIRVAMPEAVRAYLALPARVRRELESILDGEQAGWLQEGAQRDPAELDDWPAAGRMPPLCFEQPDGSRQARIGNPGRLVTITNGGQPMQLGPGWRITSVQDTFAPLLAVMLRHETEARGAWFTDLDGQMVGNQVASLSPAHQDHLAELMHPLLEGVWNRFVLAEPIDVPAPASLLGGIAMADLLGIEIAHLRRTGRTPDTLVWALDAPPVPPGMGYLVPTGSGLRGLEAGCARRSLSHTLHGEMNRLLQTGRMQWPSPVDGAPVGSDGFALMLGRYCFAYRFCDRSIGLVFYVVCIGGYFCNLGLYFPTADLLVAPTRTLAGDCVPFAQGRVAILRHLLSFGADLLDGQHAAVDAVPQLYFGASASHIGHYVWQDLCGLSYLLRAVPDETRLPHLNLFDDPGATQYFGPEEQIFPMFAGRVTRHRDPFGAGLGSFYRRNQRVIRYTATTVPAELGAAVIAAAEAVPELQAVRSLADAAQARPAPVILFGIRAGNRTLDDLADFACDLIRTLGTAFPGCTIILDGLNDVADRGGAARSRVVPDSQLAAEFAVADRIAAAAVRAQVHVHDNINRSALSSVLWCSRADAFIAPLGAALAKYRWLCNTPGLVLSSAWNLLHRADLHIYDLPQWMEHPSETLFNSADHVEDTTSFIGYGHHDGYSNFTIEREPVFALFVDLVRRHTAARMSREPMRGRILVD